MAEIDVFKNPFSIITYDKSKLRLTQKWYGFPSSEDFQKAINISLDYSETHQIKTILIDNREINIINEIDVEYAASIMPTFAKNGLKALAFIVSGKTYTQFAIDHFSNLEPTKLVEHFSDYSKALEWLDTMIT